MCNQSNFEAIGDIINDFVAEDRCFTAFDVTEEGKERETTDETYRHLKGAVHARHAELLKQSYTRTLIPTPSGNAWLYHPVGADIQPEIDRINADDDSNDNDLLPSPNQIASAAPAAMGTSQVTPQTQTAVVDEETSRSKAVTDVENRLHISSAEVKTANFTPKQVVAVVKTFQGLKIVVDPEPQVTPLKLYNVNADGRLRISKNVLEQCFGETLAGRGSFEIEAIAGCISITPA